MDENKFDTPGKDYKFDKPKIPQAWTPAPTYTVSEPEQPVESNDEEQTDEGEE